MRPLPIAFNVATVTLTPKLEKDITREKLQTKILHDTDANSFTNLY